MDKESIQGNWITLEWFLCKQVREKFLACNAFVNDNYIKNVVKNHLLIRYK